MTGNFFVGPVTEYRAPSLDRVQQGEPGVGLLTPTVSGGPR
ncbi:MAG: hypothetical protein AVDCRST_MAG57-825 [uncultured Blastococcus sp.]|uniref:Uncharacterized protein n=1 Tax=uncultured Blastococcus sp. TaxID=217144 RepID=A0A6J4HJV9_9ACTN|nr:MAG: hypothetical protein AVDCRST_MAG57-825 [uncultured Blastococcus sp.]